MIVRWINSPFNQARNLNRLPASCLMNGAVTVFNDKQNQMMRIGANESGFLILLHKQKSRGI